MRVENEVLDKAIETLKAVPGINLLDRETLLLK